MPDGRTRPTVLIVEDDIEHAAVIQAALEYRSVRVRTRVVTSGEEAVVYLKGQWPYDDRMRDPYPALLLLDHWLPHASGLEVLEWIRDSDEHGDLPVVVFTACLDPALEERCKQLGVDGFRVKPDGFGDLATTVRDALHRHLLDSDDLESPPKTG